MKVKNLDLYGSRAASNTRGHVARKRAGGTLMARDVTGQRIRIEELLFSGLTITDGGDGTGIVSDAERVVNGTAFTFDVGDVVVLQADGTLGYTTTAQDTRPVGIVQAITIPGALTPVIFQGPVQLVNVVSSVTSGDFGETSTTSGAAQSSGSVQRAGSFCVWTSDGTTPSAFLFGMPAAATVTASAGEMVPYYIPTDETFTVPLYRQGLFYHPIEVDGALVVNGILQGVD